MRLDRSKIDSLKTEITKPAMVPVEINGHSFEVQVETQFTDVVRMKVGKVIEMFNVENVKKYGEGMVATLLLISSVTDIEWEHDLKKDIDTVTLLLNSGAATQILDKVPEEMIVDIIQYMKMIQEAAEEILIEEKRRN